MYAQGRHPLRAAPGCHNPTTCDLQHSPEPLRGVRPLLPALPRGVILPGAAAAAGGTAAEDCCERRERGVRPPLPPCHDVVGR